MPFDARVKQHLAKKTREEKQQELVDQVDSWDLESMIDWIKDELDTRYEALSDDDLDEEYYSSKDYEIDCELDAEEEDDSEEDEQDEGCQCPSLFMNGHEEGCPDKRS